MRPYPSMYAAQKVKPITPYRGRKPRPPSAGIGGAATRIGRRTIMAAGGTRTRARSRRGRPCRAAAKSTKKAAASVKANAPRTSANHAFDWEAVQETYASIAAYTTKQAQVARRKASVQVRYRYLAIWR